MRSKIIRIFICVLHKTKPELGVNGFVKPKEFYFYYVSITMQTE